MNKILLLTNFLIAFLSYSSAQSLPSIVAIEYNTITDNQASIPLDVAIPMDSTFSLPNAQEVNLENQNHISIAIVLSDTLHVKKIHYSLGRSANSSDITTGEIDLTPNSYEFPSIPVSGLQTTLNLGTFHNAKNVFGEFYIEYIDGGKSPSFFKELHQ